MDPPSANGCRRNVKVHRHSVVVISNLDSDVRPFAAHSQTDLSIGMHDRVRDQFADQQKRRIDVTITLPLSQRVGNELPSRPKLCEIWTEQEMRLHAQNRGHDWLVLHAAG